MVARESSSRYRGTIPEVKQLLWLPAVPARSAPHSEVENFLMKYFQIKAQMSETQAKEMASKLRVNGNDLFVQDGKMLKHICGIHGSKLYYHLHNSAVRRVSTLD